MRRLDFVDLFEKKKKKNKKLNTVQEGTAKLDILGYLLGKANINICNTNEWIPKICDKLNTCGVEWDYEMGLMDLRLLLIFNEYHGEVPEGDDAKWFYPVQLPAEEWRVPERDCDVVDD